MLAVALSAVNPALVEEKMLTGAFAARRGELRAAIEQRHRAVNEVLFNRYQIDIGSR